MSWAEVRAGDTIRVQRNTNIQEFFVLSMETLHIAEWTDPEGRTVYCARGAFLVADSDQWPNIYITRADPRNPRK